MHLFPVIYFAYFHSHLRYGILSWGGDSQSTKVLKLQKKVVRLICNVKRKTSCRELFKTLNILLVPCVYIIETVCYIKANNKGLKQNLAIHDYETWHRSDFQAQFCRSDIFKKSVINSGTKLYNKLQNYLKNLESLKPFKKQLEAFLLQQNFYSVEEHLSYMQAPWKGILWKRTLLAIKLLIKLVMHGWLKLF